MKKYGYNLCAEDIRYASNTQLQILFGVSSKKFANWTSSEYSLPFDIAQNISRLSGLELSIVLEQWSNRKIDAQFVKTSRYRLNSIINQQSAEYNRRYYQLHIQLKEEIS